MRNISIMFDNYQIIELRSNYNELPAEGEINIFNDYKEKQIFRYLTPRNRELLYIQVRKH